LAFIVLTQSHADHFGGVSDFREAGTQIVGGPGFNEALADMNRLAPLFGPRTAKLWGSTIDHGSAPKAAVARRPRYPGRSPPDPRSGGRRFEVIHTSEGETVDSLTVWMPAERIAFTGNLFGPVFLSMPFLCTLRGDKPRSVRTYLRSLEIVRDLGAEILIICHGEPIRGAAKIRADLDLMHDAVNSLVSKMSAMTVRPSFEPPGRSS
jgi:glyoxylase-like metal-dependent hydrolase (beta-lactamase superfamily II)